MLVRRVDATKCSVTSFKGKAEVPCSIDKEHEGGIGSGQFSRIFNGVIRVIQQETVYCIYKVACCFTKQLLHSLRLYIFGTDGKNV